MTGRASFAALIGAALVAGCAAPRQAPPVGPSVAPAVYSTHGLESVMGQNARALVSLFGNPDLDAREGAARKLQFLGPACVLDAYLYAPRRGGERCVAAVHPTSAVRETR